MKLGEDSSKCPATATMDLNCDNYCNMQLFFKNSCKHPAHVALRVRLREEEPPGYCWNPEHGQAQWCTRGWFSLAPSETSAEPLVVTDNAIWYFLAWAADSNNRTVSTESSPGDEPAYLDTESGRSCKAGSQATCKPFRKVRPYMPAKGGCGPSAASCLDFAACWPWSVSASASTCQHASACGFSQPSRLAILCF